MTRSSTSPSGAPLDAEDDEALGGVVEEAPVPLLALDAAARACCSCCSALRPISPSMPTKSARNPIVFCRCACEMTGHAVERLEIRGLVEPETPRPLGERLPVHVVVLEEELAGVDVGHVLAGHDQREGDVPEPVAAAVGVVLGLVQALDETLVDAQVALQTPLQRLGVLAVEAGADVLPAGGDEDVAGEVEHGERDVEGLGEAVAEALDAVQVDQPGQLVPLGPHRAFPSACGSGAVRARRPPRLGPLGCRLPDTARPANAGGPSPAASATVPLDARLRR